MLASTASASAARGETSRAPIPASVPYVVAATRREFVSRASSGWLFQQAETSEDPKITVQLGSPVSGILLLERENNFNSIRYLTDLACQKYRLAEVLTVAVEKSGDQFIASEPRRGWFGYGDSEERAVGSFASSLVEELEGLTAREGQLSEHLREELGQLQSVVISR